MPMTPERMTPDLLALPENVRRRDAIDWFAASVVGPSGVRSGDVADFPATVMRRSAERDTRAGHPVSHEQVMRELCAALSGSVAVSGRSARLVRSTTSTVSTSYV